MLKHEDLMEKTLLNAEGFIFAIDNRHPKFPEAVCDKASLNPEWVNVVSASGLLYRTSGETVKFFEHLIEFVETIGHPEAVASIAQMQANLNSAMRIAIEGIPKKDTDGQKIP